MVLSLVALALCPPLLARDGGPGARAGALPTPRLAAAISRLPSEGLGVGLLVIDGKGRTVVERDADRPLTPASTMKVLTTACALERLGPAWTTSTEFLAEKAPDPQGRIAGTLWVRGGGDPLLRAEDLWAAVQELRVRGVTSVHGLGADPGLFTGPARPSSWPRRPVRDPYAAPFGALSLAWNSLELIVRPGPAPGSPARVDVFPVRGAVEIVNRATTGGGASLRIDLQTPPDHPGRIVVRGSIAPGQAPHREWIHLGDPARALLGGLRQLLSEAGIEVAGPMRLGPVPPGAVPVSRRESSSLAEIVRAVNKYSSNFGAEAILAHLGGTLPEPRRETAGGLAALAACLDGWRVERSRLVLADGSGYAPADRLTARALVSVLAVSRVRPAWGPELLVSFPRAGEDGSLAHRLRELRGRVRAKTGSLSGVSALAGELIARNGDALLFAILVNGPAAVPRRAADDLLAALARDLDAFERRARPARTTHESSQAGRSQPRASMKHRSETP